jgi:hypothetical protein
MLDKSSNSSFSDANKTKTLEPMAHSARLDYQKTNMSKPKLEKMLIKYGVFPDKHRALIWKFLMNLPSNNEAYDNLAARGIHSAYKNLHKTYPLKSTQLFSKLQRVLSALAHYSSIFSEVEYMPGLVFPFVKLFGNDELICFEIILSFFFQWGKHFFEYFPNPPITLIQAADELLKFHDPELSDHFRKLGLNMVDYIWPFLQNFFTDMLNREDWLALADYLVLTNDDPINMLMFVVAYLEYFRAPLLNTTGIESVEYFLKKQNVVSIQKIVSSMTKLRKTTPTTAITISYTQNLPLLSGQYPLFDFFPKYAVDQQRTIREQLLTEEQKLETRKEQIKQINVLTDDLLRQEELFRTKQEALIKAEKDRKELLIYEEEMRLQQKLKIETESRERRVEQLR